MKQGYTIIELLVMMGLFAVLVGFVTLNLFNLKARASLDTTAKVLVSDLKSQQIRAMVGDSQNAYGAHLLSNSYVLFAGQSYASRDISKDQLINLGDSVSETVTDIIFAKGSGETPAVSITLHNSANNQDKTVSLNRLGVAQ